MDIVTILRRTKKELIRKIVTSVIIQGLLLVIPVYWTNSVNHATVFEFDKAFKLVIITLILSLLYYLWSYFNQKAWYDYYNKLYLEYTSLVTDGASLDNVTLGEYTNIINNVSNVSGKFILNIFLINVGIMTNGNMEIFIKIFFIFPYTPLYIV